MANTTGLRARPQAGAEPAGIDSRETEPLLGRPGDATQRQGASIWMNPLIGTAAITQLGAVLLVVLVWAAVLQHQIILFSGHPLVQSLAIFTLIESVLFLQPTHTAEQKLLGQRVHAALNLLAFVLLVAGIAIIEYNKHINKGKHFHSIHAFLGVITSALLALQYLVGFTMWATPKMYGGEAKARSLWRYHRISGYFVLLLMLVTVVFATTTDYNVNVLGIHWWAVLLGAGLVVIGTAPRIHLQKLGLPPQSAATH